jgi:hypothetical protein
MPRLEVAAVATVIVLLTESCTVWRHWATDDQRLGFGCGTASRARATGGEVAAAGATATWPALVLRALHDDG